MATRAHPRLRTVADLLQDYVRALMRHFSREPEELLREAEQTADEPGKDMEAPRPEADR